MNREEIYKELTNIFIDIFDDDTIILDDKTTAQDIEDWDSFENVNIIVSIENCYSIKFELDEIFDIKNVGDLVTLILDKYNY